MTPKPHTNPEIAALEAQWWKDWWAADYSWDGLKARKEHAFRSVWAAEEAHLIIEPGTKRRWTRFHCPFVFADGTPSPKSTWDDATWRQVLADLCKPFDNAVESVVLAQGCVLREFWIPDWSSPERHRNVGAAQLYVAGTLGLSLPEPLDIISLKGAWIGHLRLGQGEDTRFTAAHLSLDDVCVAGDLAAGRAHIEKAGFTHARFLREVQFSGAQVDNADFAGARFAGRADFSEATFRDHAVFNQAHFADRVDFFGVRFMGRALFDQVQCLDNIGFYKAAFVRRLSINDAALYGRLNLEGATDGDPIGQSAQAIRLTATGQPADGLTGTLEPTAGPPERSFKSLPKLHARRTHFYEDANFSNRDLLSPSTFRDSVFHEKAQFHGSDIHASVNLYGTDFRRALSYSAGALPKYPEELLKLRFLAEPTATDYGAWKRAYLKGRIERRKDDFISDNYYNNLEAAFRTLKQMMEERRDRLKEGEFFNLELRARRKRKDIPLWERITSVLYWLVSDYGNSIFRPLVMLLLLYAGMAAAYYTIGQVRTGHDLRAVDGHGVFSALVFSVQNVFAPFSVLDASKFNAADDWVKTVVLPADPAQSLTVKLLASTQSLLSLTLAFLAGLAGRRRFQIN